MNSQNHISCKLTKPCRTSQMGFVLDRGAVGSVVALHEGVNGHYCYLIEFPHLLTVVSAPFNSPLIEVVKSE